MTDEHQRLEVSPPMFRNAPFTFIFYLLLIPVFGLGIILLLIWFVKVKTTRMVIDGNDLLYEQGVLSKERAQLRTDSVRTVTVNQSLGQRMFGTGDIDVYTAGDEPEVRLRGMPDPADIRERLLGRVGAD
ncbi:MAG: PH domain-containing protein [Luminiphilus sp.]|nr:PH domain-containing protein [Luminiphilus sp.]